MSVSLSLLASTALACASGACALIPQHEPSKAFNNIPENYYFSRVAYEFDGYWSSDDGSAYPVLSGTNKVNLSLSNYPDFVFQNVWMCGYDSANDRYVFVSSGDGSNCSIGGVGYQYLAYNSMIGDNAFVDITLDEVNEYIYFYASSDSSVYLTGILNDVNHTLTATTYNPFRDGTSWVDNIGVGFGIIPNLGTAINTGLDSMFYTDGVISKTATFAFTLMGIGISVGVVSLVFKWLTGRHGM